MIKAYVLVILYGLCATLIVLQTLDQTIVTLAGVPIPPGNYNLVQPRAIAELPSVSYHRIPFVPIVTNAME